MFKLLKSNIKFKKKKNYDKNSKILKKFKNFKKII